MSVMSGDRNPNWRGGRSIASNGYVLVRVGINHHLADVRGYAYEHRIVAEGKLGRRLLPGEIVHHINEITTDNRPENIEVVASIAHHRFIHRKTKRARRLPDEPNQEVACACGCGVRFKRYDASGRQRTFVSGHNPFDAPTRDAVLGALRSAGRPLSLPEIESVVDISKQGIKTALSKLRASKRVDRVSYGVWTAL